MVPRYSAATWSLAMPFEPITRATSPGVGAKLIRTAAAPLAKIDSRGLKFHLSNLLPPSMVRAETIEMLPLLYRHRVSQKHSVLGSIYSTHLVQHSVQP